MPKIYEYRGIEGLVAAKVLQDDANGYSCDTPFDVAGMAKLVRSTAQSSEAHYYDNGPKVVINGVGADTVTIDASVIPLEVLAELMGQTYDSAKGALYEGTPVQEYFAIGYKTRDSLGREVYVWRLKGTFAYPDETHSTIDAGTGADGQQLVYTGVETVYKFEKDGKAHKSVQVEAAKELTDVTNFFATVQTPDTLIGRTARTLTITQAASTTLTVKKNGVALTTGATVYDGDILQITVTGGTVKVNNVAFTSGDYHVVSGNTTVVSTAA